MLYVLRVIKFWSMNRRKVFVDNGVEMVDDLNEDRSELCSNSAYLYLLLLPDFAMTRSMLQNLLQSSSRLFFARHDADDRMLVARFAPCPRSGVISARQTHC
jgi:hypothetical protein